MFVFHIDGAIAKEAQYTFNFFFSFWWEGWRRERKERREWKGAKEI
jgi:hypothetical protein